MTESTKSVIVAVTAMSLFAYPAAGLCTTLLMATDGNSTTPEVVDPSDPRAASTPTSLPGDPAVATAVVPDRASAASPNVAPPPPQWRRVLEAIVGLGAQR